MLLFVVLALFVCVRADLPDYYCVRSDGIDKGGSASKPDLVPLYQSPCGARTGGLRSFSLMVVIGFVTRCNTVYALIHTGQYVEEADIQPCNPFTANNMDIMLRYENWELGENEMIVCGHLYGQDNKPDHDRSVALIPHIMKAARELGFDSKLAIIYFVTQAAVESSFFEVWEDQVDKVYRGRGPIRLKGFANYKHAGEDLGENFVDNPWTVTQFKNAFRTSMWVWENVFGLSNKDGLISDNKLKQIGLGRKVFTELETISKALTEDHRWTWKDRKLRFLACFANKYYPLPNGFSSICASPFGCYNGTNPH